MITEFEHQDMKEIFKNGYCLYCYNTAQNNNQFKKIGQDTKTHAYTLQSTFTHTYTCIHTQIDVSTHLGYYPLFVQQQ